MHYETRYCTHCATPLQWVIQAEDGGDVSRLRCPECGWTHWNNPTPVLAAIVELDGKVLLARTWKAMITWFMRRNSCTLISSSDSACRPVSSATSRATPSSGDSPASMKPVIRPKTLSLIHI